MNSKANRLQTYLSSLFCKCIVPRKTRYLNILNLSLFPSCSFKVTMVVFAEFFEEFYNFAVIIDSFQMSFQRLIFKTVPVKLKNYEYKKTFLIMTCVQKTSCFEVASPGHTIAYKNVDNLFKNGKNIFQFVMQPKNMMCQ